VGYSSFEDLDVWKRACRLAVRLYELLQGCRDYGLKDQITRAAVSIPSNIAEGYERDSVKESIHFFHISKGSAAELRTQLYIASRIGIISREDMQELAQESKEISSMLQGLIRSYKKK
jgi:four helix bundle protein